MSEQRPPLQPSVNFFDTLATPKQMAFVREKYTCCAEAIAQEKFSCPVDQLTKAQAYELITGEKMEKHV